MIQQTLRSTRTDTLLPYRTRCRSLAEKIIVYLCAGGGGWSTAYEMATGQHVHISINHDSDAISMHEVNHPQSEHYKADVFEVCPKKATRSRTAGWIQL